MLSDFYISIDKFSHELKECNRNLALWENLDFYRSTQMFSLGEDIGSLSDNFVRAHVNATMWIVDEFNEMKRLASRPLPNHKHLMDYLSGSVDLPLESKAAVEAHIALGQQDVERMITRNKSQAGIRSQESAAQMKVAYKTYFLFIRAFQDACYAVLLNLNGNTPGNYSSMNRCLGNNKSPLFSKVTAITGYADWFKAFKEKRDRIKLGVNFSLCGPETDVGINFVKVTPQKGFEVNVSEDGNKCRISDIVTAIDYSVLLIQLVKNNIPSNSNSTSKTFKSIQ